MKRSMLTVCLWGCLLTGVQGQTMLVAEDMTLTAWLQKVNDASRQRAYTGTFVVSAGNAMASAKIWHVCDGALQMERVEPLNGPARSTFRRNEQVITFYPESKFALSETRQSPGTFPNLLKSSQGGLDENYQIRTLPGERVVGLEADVVQLKPKDSWRFGYRVWTEKKSGLIVRLQTLDAEGRVLEQSAFSELQLDAPVSISKLTTMMNNTAGYRVERPDVYKTTAEEQGWVLRSTVAGFQPTGCYRRVVAVQTAAAPTPPVAMESASQASAQTSPQTITQCIFSDGLATLSLFMEPYDPRRSSRESVAEPSGATHAIGVRSGDWWVTAVGEVPTRTLQSFAVALERKK